MNNMNAAGICCEHEYHHDVVENIWESRMLTPVIYPGLSEREVLAVGSNPSPAAKFIYASPSLV